MRLSRAVLHATFGAALLLGSLAGEASAADPGRDNRCLRLAERHDIVTLSESGVVLDYDRSDQSTPLYGCLFSTQKVRKLEDADHQQVAMDGRYVAYYHSNSTREKYDFPDRLYVVDLVTGRIVTRSPVVLRLKKRKGCENRTQPGFVSVTRTGAVAYRGGYWYLCRPPLASGRDTAHEIIRVARPGGRPESLDAGFGLGPDSLKRSGRMIKWRHGKKSRSAFLGAPTRYSSNKCRRAAQQNYVETYSAHGVIYNRDLSKADGESRFGCLFGTQRSYLLRDMSALKPAMSGRYAAYFKFDFDDPFGFIYAIDLTDLTTGTVVSSPPLYSKELASDPRFSLCFRPVTSPIVLRADGAFAFSSGSASCENDGRALREVTTVPGPGADPVTVDRGDAIDAASLHASSDGKTLLWINGGQQRSALLGR